MKRELLAGAAIAFVCAVGLTACEMQDLLWYRQDTRTGLCFAVYNRGLASVPCSPEVMALVKQ